ncbi:MAG: ATP-dependent DNA helicase [Nanoarchaeota archaeon]
MNFFPHDHLRDGQQLMIDAVTHAITQKESVLIHAPTGIGKTAAVLAAALPSLEAHDLTLFFLTSRHTQHEIVNETLRLIRERHDASLKVANIIGKKWMCGQDAVAKMMSADFHEYCRDLREQHACTFFEKTLQKGKPTPQATVLVSSLQQEIATTPRIIDHSLKEHQCPYEVSMLLAQKARIIVTDYFYLFHEPVRNSFLGKLDKELQKSILIVDEAHNLSGRIREQMTARLSEIMLGRALAEAKKFKEREAKKGLQLLERSFNELAHPVKTEEYVQRDDLAVSDDLIDVLEESASRIRTQQQKSAIGGIAHFTGLWQGQDEGFTRILSKSNLGTVLSYRCLDPSIEVEPVLEQSHASILMSGTLSPTSMYADLLGVKGKQLTLPCPFPPKNRLNLLLPVATTRFRDRTLAQYKNIANVCSNVIKEVPGNVLIFFPSYKLMHEITPIIKTDIPLILERKGKADREATLAEFSSRRSTLAAVSAGSFGEGIDIKNNVIKTVIVVGLPLSQPNLETKALVNYYDIKYKKGWSYGYVLPAMIKAIQNAGRCIRSETDKGAIIFLDERYTHPSYFCCFPPEWQLKITRDYQEALMDFFSKR